MNDLKVTIIQSSVHWEDIDANLEMFTNSMGSIVIGSTDIIVLPEMFTTGFTMNAGNVAEDMDGKAVTWMRKQAAKKKCVITGSLIIKEGGEHYNRLVWMKPDGTYETYDKRHLFRMGEEDKTYKAGTKRLIVEYKGWKICPLICYDLRFPVWSRNTNNEYDCLIYVASWPDVRSYPWRQLLIARAIENQAYVVGVNRIGVDDKDMAYSGYSSVLDPRGQLICSPKPDKPAVEVVALSGQGLLDFRKAFPVSLDADMFEIK
ncbi:MAG TPA: amidohydrolase [Bacteroidia bacterium]|jgi:omega-amidase|nr:amidohydrolase [Bacteroidia bacterium]